MSVTIKNSEITFLLNLEGKLRKHEYTQDDVSEFKRINDSLVERMNRYSAANRERNRKNNHYKTKTLQN